MISFHYSLFVFALCITVVTPQELPEEDSTVHQLKKDLEEIRNETKHIIEEVNKKKEELREKVEIFKKNITEVESTNRNLSAEGEKLFKEILHLNISITDLENSIEVDKGILASQKHEERKLRFILKLELEILRILQERKERGDAKTCYEFLNYDQEIVSSVRGQQSSNIKQILILGELINQAQLNRTKAKIALFTVDQQLILENTKEQGTTIRVNAITKSLDVYIAKSEENLKKLNDYIKWLELEKDNYQKEIVKEWGRTIETYGDIEEVKKELFKYADDIECYRWIVDDI